MLRNVSSFSGVNDQFLSASDEVRNVWPNQFCCSRFARASHCSAFDRWLSFCSSQFSSCRDCCTTMTSLPVELNFYFWVFKDVKAILVLRSQLEFHIGICFRVHEVGCIIHFVQMSWNSFSIITLVQIFLLDGSLYPNVEPVRSLSRNFIRMIIVSFTWFCGERSFQNADQFSVQLFKSHTSFQLPSICFITSFLKIDCSFIVTLFDFLRSSNFLFWEGFIWTAWSSTSKYPLLLSVFCY